MIFEFTFEQDQLRSAVRGFLGQHAPMTAVRKAMESGVTNDPVLWKRLADELGLQGIIVPQEHGGAGYGTVELAVVLEEMGRALYPGPFLSTVVLGVKALLEVGGDSPAGDILAGIAAGDTVVALALAEDDGWWTGDTVSTRAVRSIAGWRVSGEKRYVVDGEVADVILVPATTESGGVSLFAVDRTAAGLTVTSRPTLDQTRPLADVSLVGTPGRLVGREGSAVQGLNRTMDYGAALLAAEQLGGAQVCLDRTVAYVKERRQFGRPVGSFQAVQHKCVDMLVKVECSRSAAYYAAWIAEDSSEEFGAAAALAKAYCCDAFRAVAGECIQLHGGIGFTWEHDAHLYFKRAEGSYLLFGNSAVYRDKLVQRIGV